MSYGTLKLDTIVWTSGGLDASITVSGFIGSVNSILSGYYPSGTEANPALTIGTSGNGLYSPATNEIAISTSGVQRLSVAENGVTTVQNGAAATIDTLADAATVTPDLAESCNFTLTITGNRTLANPINITSGQTGSIFIIQGSGSNTLSWGSYWDFPGGTAPTLTTASGAVDRVDYIVRSSTSIHTVFTANYS